MDMQIFNAMLVSFAVAMNIYSETLKTPIRKFLIFKIYKTFSK